MVTASGNNNNNSGRRELPEYVQRWNLGAVSRFPTHLNRQDGCLQFLDISPDNLAVTYSGRGRDDSEAGAIRTDAPIPPCLPFFYFETKVVSKGRDGYLAIGLMTSRSQLDRLVGWSEESIGYHGDDGNIFRASGTGEDFGPEWGQDDVVGCGVDFCEKKILFVKNGVIVGNCEIPRLGSIPLYPALGLRTPGEKLQINLLGPFEFDVVSHLERKAWKICSAVSSKTISSSPVQDFILFYLIYHGYEESFYSVLKTLPATDPRQALASDRVRSYFEEKRIQRELFRLIESGKIVHAGTLLQVSFSGISEVLEIQFMLCGVELLEVAFSLKHQLKDLLEVAMRFQTLNSQLKPSKDSIFKKAGEEIISVLAFKDPRQVPEIKGIDRKYRLILKEQLQSIFNRILHH